VPKGNGAFRLQAYPQKLEQGYSGCHTYPKIKCFIDAAAAESSKKVLK